MELEQFRQRLAERLKASGKSRHALSKEIGANPGYVRDLLDPAKSSMPSAVRMQQLATALGTTTDYLTGLSATTEAVLSEVTVMERPDGWRRDEPPPDRRMPLVGTGDCAALEFEDETGELVDIERSSFDPDHIVRMITRPPALTGGLSVYAIYFQGESMMPRFEPGEIGVVDPTRPARPGDYVLVQLNDGETDDVTSVLAKRLISANTREVWLEQFNPPVRFKVPRNRVARLHRIIPPTDLLFN